MLISGGGIRFYEISGVKYYVATDRHDLTAEQVASAYKLRWTIGVSSQGHINQSMKVRPRIKDSNLVAEEAPWRETNVVKPSDNILTMKNEQSSRPQRAVNADVASLHVNPVAETVDNVRKQQGRSERSLIQVFSPAGYQRWHGAKVYVETGEALGIRRRKSVEEASLITLSGKWMSRYEELSNDLLNGTYSLQENRKVDIPKDNGKVRTLQIPCIRDRVVQGALKLILESIFEADFCHNSYGFRPKRSPHLALSAVRRMNRVIDVDLTKYFDNIQHSIL